MLKNTQHFILKHLSLEVDFVLLHYVSLQLQEAFAAGLLKPGLHRAVPESGAKKVFVNNVDGLKQKLAELQAPVKSFNWIERLDHVVLKSAPLAPELALKEADLSKKAGKADAGSDVHNDFQREMTFYRQAQATVLEVLPRLQVLPHHIQSNFLLGCNASLLKTRNLLLKM